MKMKMIGSVLIYHLRRIWCLLTDHLVVEYYYASLVSGDDFNFIYECVVSVNPLEIDHLINGSSLECYRCALIFGGHNFCEHGCEHLYAKEYFIHTEDSLGDGDTTVCSAYLCLDCALSVAQDRSRGIFICAARPVKR